MTDIIFADDKEIQMELSDDESVFVDRENRGLYLVEYPENDLFGMWNSTQVPSP